MALRITKRASSTQQSEYSKPICISGLVTLPAFKLTL
ncbi:Uncharacterised protein [Vibrio cholerae]|nr:Uncharacterised protein [Vibrio cholerae]CSI70558.1 Uncharacterised protein [Vibrio cholerae]